MTVLHLLMCISTFGGAFPFLLKYGQQNVTSVITDQSYNNLIQSLVDEKDSHHQLENKLDVLSRRLDGIDELHRKVNIQLDKDKNNGESTLEKFADIEHQLRNLTATRDQLMAMVGTDHIKTNMSTVQQSSGENLTNLTKLKEHTGHELTETQHSAGLQIGFAVYKPNTSQPADGPIIFTVVHFNSDDLYNTTTGIVTCKIAGLYYLTATVERYPGVIESYCHLRVNNATLDSVLAAGFGSTVEGYPSGTTSLVYHLGVGDTIHLGPCGEVGHMHWSSGFQGFLIAPDTL